MVFLLAGAVGRAKPVIRAQLELAHFPKKNGWEYLRMGQTICHTQDSVDLCNRTRCEDIAIFAKVIFLRFVRFSLRALEYGFGVYVGAILGLVVGYFSGGVYAELFEPVYFADFPHMEEVMRWDQMPYTFAAAGIFAGAIAGALAVFIVPGKGLESPSDGPAASQWDS